METTKKKILFLDHAPYEGGAEVSFKELISHLSLDRYQPYVVVPPNAPYVKEIDATHVSFVYQWKQYKFIAPVIFDALRLVQVVNSVQPDIIHTNTRVTNILGGVLYSLKPLSSALQKAKFINHVRDKDPLPAYKAKLIGKCDHIIVNSEGVADFLKGYSFKKPMSVIYNGIDLTLFDPDKVEVIKPEYPVITFIGQIYPRKGIHTLLTAVAQVTKQIPSVRLRMIGQDPTIKQVNIRQYKQTVQELGIRTNIEWLGYLDYHTQIPAKLGETDLFVLPSLEEPFGRVLIDAMAMGKPVIGTNVGGIPEIIDDGICGYLVPPKDTKLLAERMVTLLQDQSLAQKMGQAGREKVEAQFSLKKHVQLIQDLYNKVCP